MRASADSNTSRDNEIHYSEALAINRNNVMFFGTETHVLAVQRAPVRA